MTKTLLLGTRLSDALKRDANNFDLLRLLAASLSIWGHAYAISPRQGMVEPLQQLLHFEYAGSLAISILFFISGLLVTDSYLRTPNILLFVSARAGRLMPGLWVCLLITAFVIGPLFTRLDLYSYLTHPATLSYYARNGLLTDLQWHLPGVFESSPYGLNGSLWSLPLGARLYLAAALLGFFGILRYSLLATCVIVALFLVGVFFPKQVPYFLDLPLNVKAVAPFLFGMLLAVNKHYMRISLAVVLAAIGVAYFGWSTSWRILLFHSALYLSLLYLFTVTALRKLRLPGDYSYGVYIYGFPVQQVVAHLQPSPHPWVNAAFSLPIALGLGAASWHLIEKPASTWVKNFAAARWSESRHWRVWLERHRASLRPAAAIVSLLLPLLLAKIEAVPSQLQAYGDSRIVRYGPNTVKAGQVFNRQADGEAAIWVNLDAQAPIDGTVAIGGVRLASVRNGTTISAVVPKYIYATPRQLPIWVEYTAPSGGKLRTPEVLFRVE